MQYISGNAVGDLITEALIYGFRCAAIRLFAQLLIMVRSEAEWVAILTYAVYLYSIHRFEERRWGIPLFDLYLMRG